MLCEQENLDINSVRTGVTKFAKYVLSISKEKLKAREKEEIAQTITELYNTYKNYILTGVCNTECPISDVTRSLFHSCMKECDDAAKSKRGTPKMLLFDLFVRYLRDICEADKIAIIEENEIPLVSMITKLCEHDHIRNTFMENNVMDIFLKFASNAEFSSLSAISLPVVWQMNWKRISESSESSALLSKFMKIGEWMLRTFPKTILDINWKVNMDMAFESIFSSHLYKRMSDNRVFASSLVEFLSMVMDYWGLEIREKLISLFSPLVNEYCCGNKLTIDEADSAGIKGLWKFSNIFLSLAFPDVSPTSIVDENLYSICTAISHNNMRTLSRFCAHRNNLFLTNIQIATLAKCIVISELNPNAYDQMDTTVLESQNVSFNKSKRFKWMSPFEKLMNCDFETTDRSRTLTVPQSFVQNCLMISEEIVVRYKNKIGSHNLRKFAIGIWNMKTMCNDSSRAAHCSVLQKLVDSQGFGDYIHVKAESLNSNPMEDPRVRVRNLWMYALSCSNVDGALENAVLLMSSLLDNFVEILGDVDVVCTNVYNVLAKAQNEATLTVLSSFLKTLDFDERTVFTGGFDTSTGIPSLRLRCQLSEWLVRKFKENISKQLVLLCWLHPQFVRLGICNTSEKTKNSEGFIEDLIVLNNINANDKTSSTLLPNIILPDLVEYIMNLLQDLWYNCELENRVNLWNTIIHFIDEISFSDPSFLSMFGGLLQSLNEWILELCASNNEDILIQLQPNRGVYRLAPEALSEVSRIASNNPQLFVSFNLDVSAVPPNFLVPILDEATGSSYKSEDSILFKTLMKRLLQFSQQVDFLPDLLLLISKYGRYVNTDVRNKLYKRAINIYIEDKASEEQNPLEIEAARLQLVEIGILYKCSKYTELLADDDFTKKSLVKSVVLNIENAQLSVNHLTKLVEFLVDTPLLLRKTVWYIFNTGEIWSVHTKVLAIVLRNANLSQVIMEFVPNFEDIFNFHAFSLAIANHTISQENFFHSRFLSFASNPVVKKKDNWDSSCFPQAFNLNCEYWPKVVSTFWSLFESCCHEVLLAIRASTITHVNLGMELRMVLLLQAITSNCKCIDMNLQYRKGFGYVIRTSLLSLMKGSIDRKCSLSEMHSILKHVNIVIEQLFDDQKDILLLISDIVKPEHDYFPMFMASKAKLLELCRDEVHEFFTQDQYSNIPLLLTESFWKVAEEFLQTNVELLNAEKYIGTSKLNNILQIWELVEPIRQYIAPILYLFGKSTSQLLRFTCNTKEGNAASFLKFVCEIILNYYWPSPIEWYACALSVLSCSVFKQNAILYPPTKEIKIPLISPKSTDLSVELCTDLLNCTIRCEKNSPLSLALKFYEKFIPYLPECSALLSPFLCQSKDAETGSMIASLILKFAMTKLNVDTINVYNDQIVRTVRTICECVDGVGLHRMEALQYDSEIMRKLGTLACSAGFYDHAYFFANLAFDKFLGKDRALVAVGLSTVENESLFNLLKEIYLGTKNVAALDSLPPSVQNDDRVQQLRTTSSCSWLRVASDGCSTAEEIVFARWFCGVESPCPDKDVAYLNSVLHNDFNLVSYPKILNSQWKRLYALIKLRSNGHDILPYVKDTVATQLAKGRIIDLKSCKELFVFFLLMQPYDYIFSSNCTIQQQCLAVIYGFGCCLHTSNENSQDRLAIAQEENRMVLETVRKLVDLKAHSACISLLNSWLKIFPRDVRSHQILVEQCKVQVAMGDYYIAQHRLTEIAKNTLSTTVAVEVMCLLSSIFAENMKNLDQAIRVMRDLVDSLPAGSKQSSYAAAYRQLHSLAVKKLYDLEAYMESPTIKLRRQAVAEWKKQLASHSAKLDKKQRVIIQKELLCEEDELKKAENSLKISVSLAVSSGLNLLKSVSPTNDNSCYDHSEGIQILFPLLDIIFRYEHLTEVADILRKYVVSMTPSVWVLATPHIVSHCFKDDPLSLVVQDIVIKVIIAYPYHTVHTILAYKYDGEKRSKHADKVKQILAMAESRSKDPKLLKNVLMKMNTTHNVYRLFNWMNINDPQYFTAIHTSNGQVKYEMSPKVTLLEHLTTLRSVPLPMIHQPMGNAGDYSTDNFIKWDEIDTMIDKADGISTPKIVRVRGSNQQWYKIVWKKGEDVRQDSLVEHLFEVMNFLLSSRQPLRTYRVIPLDSLSGIIEFCDGTKSLKELLVGPNLRSGLHYDIYPEESVVAARQRLHDASRAEFALGIDEYKNTIKGITPVFRHYFYRNFPTVQEWTRMINNYTLSLAEWSIVCYVVGLGDRHSSNVLFETATSNFVHIDLGMILEFGKRVLQIPERVPFRMTRDILDPILIQGTQGNLLQRATLAMENMRKHREVILGVASVFLRESIANFRDSTDGRPSFVSATAIERLKDKLNGTDSTISAVSPYIQVKRLMSEATNIEHLARIFTGWLSII